MKLCFKSLVLMVTIITSLQLSAMEVTSTPPAISETRPIPSIIKLTESDPRAAKIFEQCRAVFVAAFLAQEIERFGQEPDEFDEEDVAKITADCEAGKPLAQSIEEVLSSSWNWRDRVDEATHKTYLVYIEHEGTVIGFALFIQSLVSPFADPTQITLEFLAIMPSYQGHKLSRPLIFSILDDHSEIQSITLEALPFYTKTHRFYEHLAFRNEDKDSCSSNIRFTWYRKTR